MSGERDLQDDPEGALAELYRDGIRYFNECEFYEAHEVWEELWSEYRGDLREFFQGLIQAAVALHHFGNGNVRGARKVYASSCRYLQSYRPHCLGLDLDDFLRQYEACFAPLLSDDKSTAAINPNVIPEIHLCPELGAPHATSSHVRPSQPKENRSL